MDLCDTNDVRKLAESLGFALCGVAGAEPSNHDGYIREWLADDKHGEMAYLANHLDVRLDPEKLLPGARSVICVADRYPAQSDARDITTNKDPKKPSGEGRRGKVARYAWGDDYHRVMKKRLFALADSLREKHPDHQFKVAVDTAPILEREHATRAGLGWTGKHTLLIHPEVGSWLLLGEIVTTLPIEAGREGEAPEIITDHCGTCTRCIDACPTQCITPYKLDASRCISYLTLEHRSVIDPELHEPMGDWIAGCDVCQEVCPYNQEDRIEQMTGQPQEPTRWPIHPRYTPRPPAPAIDLLEVLGWDEEDRRESFRGSALKRIKLDMLKRNALIAARNYLAQYKDDRLLQRIKELANDHREPELVRTTARQVLDQIKNTVS